MQANHRQRFTFFFFTMGSSFCWPVVSRTHKSYVLSVMPHASKITSRALLGEGIQIACFKDQVFYTD